MNKSKRTPFLLRISDKWADWRWFAFYNKTIFEIGFMVLYTLEQAFLIFIVSRGLLTSVTVSYFVLFVLLTFSIHKIIMESRIRLLNDEISDIKREKDRIKLASKKLTDNYARTLEVSKNLRQRFIHMATNYEKIRHIQNKNK